MKIENFISYEQPTNYIVHSDQYTKDGQIPVLTAGQSFVLGYTDEEDGIYTGEPVVIFDDFTTSVQYVDFPFKVKSSAMKILKNKQNANIKFCYYLLSWLQKMPPNHKRQWISTTSQIDVNLPPIEWQKKIVQKIEAVSNIIKYRKEELKKLDELVSARFVEMFGDPITNPKGWDMVELGELTDIGSSKRIFEKEYVSEGIPFYRTKEIVELSKGNSISTELFITEERFAEIKEKYGVPKTGDLLISAVGTIGVIWIVDGKNDFYFKDGNLIRVDGSEKFNSVYVKNLLEYLIDEYKKQMSTGTAYAALTISGLTKMKVYDVPMELQEQFAAIVQRIDKSKVAVKKALDETQLLFDSLMQKYFG